MRESNDSKRNQDSLEQELKKKDPEQDIDPQRESDSRPKQNDKNKDK
ncbi:hypothetical protein [Virgibacillus sp. SK37]|nr:hypothetical protein [Virgibacillus sp. SK37]AIF45609.1 hypothetical protein X953_17445 [Virgibacillus sp. SK37]